MKGRHLRCGGRASRMGFVFSQAPAVRRARFAHGVRVLPGTCGAAGALRAWGSCSPRHLRCGGGASRMGFVVSQAPAVRRARFAHGVRVLPGTCGAAGALRAWGSCSPRHLRCGGGASRMGFVFSQAPAVRRGRFAHGVRVLPGTCGAAGALRAWGSWSLRSQKRGTWGIPGTRHAAWVRVQKGQRPGVGGESSAMSRTSSCSSGWR
jgi:hypothetical protein